MIEQGKRKIILEAAIKVFAEKGFHQAKVEDIALEAQIGKGTVYEYFASKSEIIYETVSYINEDFLQSITREIEAVEGALEKIRALVHVHLKWYTHYRDRVKIILSLHRSEDKNFHRLLRSIQVSRVEAVERIIRAGQTNREIKPQIDSKAAAYAVIGSIGGALAAVLAKEESPNDEDKEQEREMLEILDGVLLVLFKGLAV